MIFGTGQIADVARVYLEQAGVQICGFTVDDLFVTEAQHDGLPVVPWSTLAANYPPDAIRLFCPISYRKVNTIRKAKFEQGKSLGYNFISFIHGNCVNNSHSVGENCFILENNVLQPFSKIGNNVVLWSGNHIGHHSSIGDHCFLASHVVISGGVTIGSRSFLGVNATVGDNTTIGEAAVVGAGALVLRDLPSESVIAAHASEISPVPSSRLRGF